jgi:hypothetical protein
MLQTLFHTPHLRGIKQGIRGGSGKPRPHFVKHGAYIIKNRLSTYLNFPNQKTEK